MCPDDMSRCTKCAFQNVKCVGKFPDVQFDRKKKGGKTTTTQSFGFESSAVRQPRRVQQCNQHPISAAPFVKKQKKTCDVALQAEESQLRVCLVGCHNAFNSHFLQHLDAFVGHERSHVHRLLKIFNCRTSVVCAMYIYMYSYICILVYVCVYIYVYMYT